MHSTAAAAALQKHWRQKQISKNKKLIIISILIEFIILFWKIPLNSIKLIKIEIDE